MQIDDVSAYMHDLGRRARTASRALAAADTAAKNAALHAIADELDRVRDELIAENRKDLEAGAAKGLDAALLDRLELNQARIDGMIEGLRQIAALPDPIGEIFDLKFRPSGIQVGRMRVPLGVVGIIYESRPNVTADAAALCLKSGNATVLRGGSEAFHSNQAIAASIQSRPGGRRSAGRRGPGGGHHRPCGGRRHDHHARIHRRHHPARRQGPDRAHQQRCARPGDQASARHLPCLRRRRGRPAKGVRRRPQRQDPALRHLQHHGDPAGQRDHRRAISCPVWPRPTRKRASNCVAARGPAKSWVTAASPPATADWDEEYLAAILSIRVVADLDEAMDHIARHGSMHTESIVTENFSKARRFLREVDASSVMVNASTRFADGFEYGLGAEIGISTDKFHARGPVGLEGLTSVKFIVLGDGHIRE